MKAAIVRKGRANQKRPPTRGFTHDRKHRLATVLVPSSAVAAAFNFLSRVHTWQNAADGMIVRTSHGAMLLRSIAPPSPTGRARPAPLCGTGRQQRQSRCRPRISALPKRAKRARPPYIRKNFTNALLFPRKMCYTIM